METAAVGPSRTLIVCVKDDDWSAAKSAGCHGVSFKAMFNGHHAVNGKIIDFGSQKGAAAAAVHAQQENATNFGGTGECGALGGGLPRTAVSSCEARSPDCHHTDSPAALTDAWGRTGTDALRHAGVLF